MLVEIYGAKKTMFKLIRNNKAVSQVLSFVISLGLTATVVLAAGFLTSYYVDENTESAAQAEAENIANRVFNLLVNVYLIKEQYPDVNYSTTMDIPLRLVNHYEYAIQVDSTGVHVNSYDNRIQVTKSFFDISEKLHMDVQGDVAGSNGKLTVKCSETNYVDSCKYDFGTTTSDLIDGYERKTETDVTNSDGSRSRNGPELGQDFVHGSSTPGQFIIGGLESTKSYSLTFTVGDKEAYTTPGSFKVDNMKITTDGRDKNGGDYMPYIEISCSQSTPLNKGFISEIYSESDGSLMVTFTDTDTAGKYWAIGGLTVEEGERKIIVEGGD